MPFIHDFFTYLLYQPLFNALIFLAYLIPGHSIGWAIIAMTLLIRIVLYPTSAKTMEQQRRMSALQPKVAALKEIHGEDKAAHSKAVMELYAAEKVSPFGTCLPTIVQIIVLGVMYQVFIQGLSTSGFSLLYRFTPHLSTINAYWFGLDLTKPEPWILPILSAGLQYVLAKQMAALTPPTATKPGEQDVSQIMSKQMSIITPILTFVITVRLPAALGLYWVATTLAMILQQWHYMRRPLPTLSNVMKAKNNVQVTIRAKGSTGDDDAEK